MVEKNSQRDPIPEHFADLEAAAEFWDSHDLADYEDLTGDEGNEIRIDIGRAMRTVCSNYGEGLRDDAGRASARRS